MLSGTTCNNDTITDEQIEAFIKIKKDAAAIKSSSFSFPDMTISPSIGALCHQDYNGRVMHCGNVDINNGYLLTDGILIERNKQDVDIIDVDVDNRKLMEVKAKINGIDYYGMKIQLNLKTMEVMVDGISINNLTKAIFTLVLMSKLDDGNLIARLPKDLLNKLVGIIMPLRWADTHSHIPFTKRVIGHFFPVHQINSASDIANEKKQLNQHRSRD